MDIISRARKQPGMQTTHSLRPITQGSVSLSPGGVGRNIAEATHRILSKKPGSQIPVLISFIGEDTAGRVLQEKLSRIARWTGGLIPVPGEACAIWCWILKGDYHRCGRYGRYGVTGRRDGRSYTLRNLTLLTTASRSLSKIESVQPEFGYGGI